MSTCAIRMVRMLQQKILIPNTWWKSFKKSFYLLWVSQCFSKLKPVGFAFCFSLLSSRSNHCLHIQLTSLQHKYSDCSGCLDKNRQMLLDQVRWKKNTWVETISHNRRSSASLCVNQMQKIGVWMRPSFPRHQTSPVQPVWRLQLRTSEWSRGRRVSVCVTSYGGWLNVLSVTHKYLKYRLY